MMNKKGIQTTIVAFILLALLLSLVFSFIFDKIELDELKTILIIV
ncbi:unnamed protein product, partial [marine sediment metagenome]